MSSAPSLESLRRTAAAQLADISDSPDLDARRLLEHATGLSATQLIIEARRAAHEHERDSFEHLLERRLSGEPLAYVVGHVGFHDLELVVTPDVLIPRPDTETLVDAALERLPSRASLDVADLGTGSGAIALALAKARPHWRILGTDISQAALDCARANAENLGLANVRFAKGHWFEALTGEHFDALVSNPPYIAPGDIHLQAPALRHEPQGALVADRNGLAAIEEIARGAPDYLNTGGWLLLEHGCGQGAAVRAILHGAGLHAVETIHDLGGHPRVALGNAD